MTAGTAEIAFADRDGRTRLAHLYQRDPLRVLFPAPESGDPALAVILTTSGGLVGGDRLEVSVHLAAGTAAHVTAAAAEKIYRSLGATTAIAQCLAVGAGAWLEFLPPETILFERAKLRRETTVALAPGAGFLGGDIIVFGRRARGERFTSGLLREVWQVEREGRLVWGDALHLADDIGAAIDAPAGFAGAAACATLILAPPQRNPRAFLDRARAVQARSAAPGLRSGVTAIADLVVARWLGPDATSLRRAYADLACHLREAAMGLPGRLPRIWHA